MSAKRTYEPEGAHVAEAGAGQGLRVMQPRPGPRCDAASRREGMGQMRTTVVHCKKEPFDILIDRRTKWGNPFRIGIHGTRDEVIAKYREWILTKPDLLAELYTLRGKRLGCWCKPEACHGDVLVDLIHEKAEFAPCPPAP